MNSYEEYRYDVFISYSHKDEVWVRDWLLPELERGGVSVCIDYRDFEPGAPSLTEMERAVLTSHKTLLIVTSNYINSEWTEFETLMAQTLDPAARRRRIIPLMLEKVELPLRLSTLTYLDFYNPKTSREQLERLTHATKHINTISAHPRILLVENEASWIKIARAVLIDYDVDEVRTSAEGIFKLEAGTHYDLVLTNLNLTQVNEASGEEVLEYIRDHRPSLPRIVVTGKPIRGPIYSTLFERYEITEFITKSDINVPELRQLVRKILLPLKTGTMEFEAQKNDLVNKLHEQYNESMRHLNEGLKALDVYEVRLRREVGQHQAEDLTRPDRDALIEKRKEYKRKYDDILSRLLAATRLDALGKIGEEFRNGW